MRRALVATAIVVMLATSCGRFPLDGGGAASGARTSPLPTQAASSARTSPPPTPADVAWRPLPPTGVIPQAVAASPVPPLQVPAGTPECNAGQLEGVLEGLFGAMGHANSPISLRNTSSRECFLEGVPGITILDAGGHKLAAAAGPGEPTYFNDGPVVPVLMRTATPPLPPLGAAADSRPALGQAFLNVEWYECSLVTAASLAIQLPNGGGVVTVPYPVKSPSSPGCGNAGLASSALARGPFSPGGMQWPPGPAVLLLTISASAPASVTAGSTFVYYITLRNDGGMAYRLTGQCPDYSEFLDKKTALEVYQLNCMAAGDIAPGGEVRFEMRMNIPATTPAGANVVTWYLVDYRVTSATSRAVEIPVRIA